jgi:ribonuclease G
VARQLSLRNLSGIIIVDFIDMESKEDQESLMRVLGEELSRDPVKTILVDMTRLGLVEITRKKVRRPLHEIL